MNCTKDDSEKPSIVPLLIYQTWHSLNLPPKMTEVVNKLKQDNPEFEHHLYDDMMCRIFIRDNFDESVLYAYDKLVPGAYKADLWRYCILYKMGGIYLDIKFQCEPGFSLIELTKDPETFVFDRPYVNECTLLDENLSILNSSSLYEDLPIYIDAYYWKNKQIGLYNALIVTTPNNNVLYECIQQIIKNVLSNYYGYNYLFPTGPGLLGEIYFSSSDEYNKKIKDLKYFYSICGKYIINKNKKVLSHYLEYREEQYNYNKSINKLHYSNLWPLKHIYHSTF